MNFTHWFVARAALKAAVLVSLFPRVASAKTALDFLREAPKPHFAQGHSLKPLTRWGWTMPFDVRVELAENWGYALEFGGYATETAVAKLDDPESDASKLCALTAADPQRYPLAVLLHRPCNSKAFRATLPESAWCHDAEGKLPGGKQVWSTEAPDSIFEEAGRQSAAPLKKILAKAPIALVLNGGEYGLNVYGFAKTAWQADPNVMAAKGDREWFDYLSESKVRQELPIATAVRQANPEGLYIYYHTFATHRNRYGSWWTWAYKYDQLRKISDLASSSVYYGQFNTGWTGDNSMLTQALNSVAQQLAFGDALSYNWVCAGWTHGDPAKSFGDLDRYLGYLKCYYTAGMIGGCAGYFSYPKDKGGFGGDYGDEPPHWLRQMMVLGRVQALFSHLEEFVRNGDLLPGPDKHVWSRELPAYEFPTGDPEVRVLARKHRQREEWLITAWAAGGEDREVTVSLPKLGEVVLLARSVGSVYRATLAGTAAKLTLVDRDGRLPTAQ